MSPNYKMNKVNKKQRRSEAIIQKECKVQPSKVPTPFLAILNAGLATGLTESKVLAEASPHGEVTQIIMLPNKSYCFLECINALNAEQIYLAMHNVAKIGQNESVVFLSFFEQLPASEENIWRNPWPKGLFLVDEFVSSSEEAEILHAVSSSEENAKIAANPLKHRCVKHFGYEFIYGKNNVDPNRPLEQTIPAVCDVLWPRFKLAAVEHDLPLEWHAPDQLTVNSYKPGQGIPQHVDTHSAFLDPILILSLQGDVVMEFRSAEKRSLILLPQRSLLIMSGESRYNWMHGIAQRMTDIVPTPPTGSLTSRPRTLRTSLTFRRLRKSSCNCAFPMLCDTRLDAKPNIPATELNTIAENLEERNVHSVYDQIANHFSETRHTPWPQVTCFLSSFETGSTIIDVGCGNGKYLNCIPGILMIGCDRSHGLLNVCAYNRRSVFRCHCLHVPIRTQSVDGCISIAVIHHLATPERRLAAIIEMARLLRTGGKALIYVWAKNQQEDKKKI